MRLGFNDRFDSYAANISNPPQPGKWFMFDKVRYGTHGNTMRFPVYWWLVQPNNQYENNLAAYYHDVKEQADAYGIKLIPMLLECPAWAREAPSLNYPSGSYIGQFGAFGRMVLDYFGSSLAAIEVWNEPNKTAHPVPRNRYSSMLANVLQRICPDYNTPGPVPVLGGALAVGTGSSWSDYFHYIDSQCYPWHLSVHTYSNSPSTVASTTSDITGKVQTVINEPKNGQVGGIWVTETGAPSSNFGFTQAMQADVIDGVNSYLAGKPIIKSMIIHRIYQWPDSPDPPNYDSYAALKLEGSPLVWSEKQVCARLRNIWPAW